MYALKERGIMWTLREMDDTDSEIINDPIDSSTDLGDISDPQE